MSAERRSLTRRVRAQMVIRADGTVGFKVRGYDFRFSDMPIDVNGYLFAPVRSSRVVRPEPCPFCGSEAMVRTWETNDDPRLPGWRCGCLEPDCDMNPFTTRWKTEREAIESWNRRSNAQGEAQPPATNR